MITKKTADLPLHTGQAPPWLFKRMVRLARSICELIIIEFGSKELLKRLADPIWFQALGCVLGFDWHSSGLTTVTCGAIKQAYKDTCGKIGIHIAGGKGKSALNTPREITEISDKVGLGFAEKLIYASRLSAKVDSCCIQDGYKIYHHCFIFDDEGNWTVIQQGLNEDTRYARRYHWFTENTIRESFTEEPHSGIISSKIASKIDLNMVAQESKAAQQVITELAKTGDLKRNLLEIFDDNAPLFKLPQRHSVNLKPQDAKKLFKIAQLIEENPPQTFEELIGRPKIGPQSVMALALVSELIYNTPVCRKDPAIYSFAHGGKDGHPFPVQRKLYDESIAILEETVLKAKLPSQDKDNALRRLQMWLRLRF